MHLQENEYLKEQHLSISLYQTLIKNNIKIYHHIIFKITEFV